MLPSTEPSKLMTHKMYTLIKGSKTQSCPFNGKIIGLGVCNLFMGVGVQWVERWKAESIDRSKGRSVLSIRHALYTLLIIVSPGW